MLILDWLAQPGLALAALCCLAGTALADGAYSDAAGFPPAADTLPTFAQAPSNSPSPWTGLSIGTDFSVAGGKGLKGGVGGDLHLSYNRELPNHLVIGVQAVSGYAPSLAPVYSRVNGFDYAGANAVVGYDMGRFEPYVTAGVGFAKADLAPSGLYDTSQSLDNLFNKGNGPLLTTTTVGAGFNYAVTNNFSMGMSFTATQVNNNAPAAPYLP